MSRPAAVNDFSIQVDGVGTLIFARRSGRDRFRIAAEYHRLTEGLEVGDTEFGLTAEAVATVKVLLVDGPADIVAAVDLDAPADPSPETDARLVRVFLELRKKELSFRPGQGAGSQAQGQEDGSKPGVLVSPQVQPGPV